MKLTPLSFFSIETIFLFRSANTKDKEICLVTEGFTNGTNYIVCREQPSDIARLDSLIFYRKPSIDNVFRRIVAAKFGVGEPIFIDDATVNSSNCVMLTEFKNTNKFKVWVNIANDA